MKKPVWLRIEISEDCNLRCPMCTSRPQKRYMEPALLWRILENASEWCPSSLISLSISGEPSVHPEFEHILKGVSRFNRLATMHFSTNGIQLNSRLLDIIFDSGRFYWIIYSLDAVSDQVYGCVRPGGSVDGVEKNIDYHIFKRSTQEGPDLQLQFIVMKANAGEAPLFAIKWARKLMAAGLPFSMNRLESDRSSILFVPEIVDNPAEKPAALSLYRETIQKVRDVLINHGGQLAELGFGMGAGPETISNPARHETGDAAPSPRLFVPCTRTVACIDPWEVLSIETSGNVSFCCSGDRAGQICTGSVLHENLEEIWTGPAAKAFRHAHLTEQWKLISRCSHCNARRTGKFRADHFHGTAPDHICRNLGRHDATDMSIDLIDITPRAPVVLRERALTLIDHKDWTEAEEILMQLVLYDPQPEHYRMLGYVRQRQMLLKEALAAHEMALQMDPEFLPSLLQSGCILLELGDYEASRRFFLSAARHAPPHLQTDIQDGLKKAEAGNSS